MQLANWVNEFERFTPSIPVILYHGPPNEREALRSSRLQLHKSAKPEINFPIVVTTYEIVMNDRKHLSRTTWKYVVVDESHRLKNMNCKYVGKRKIDK
jgi:ATP-dependent DNA helicase